MSGSQSTLAVTAGSGSLLNVWTRTIGANSVIDQFVLPGEYPYASYTAIGGGISAATANDHIIEVMAGSSLPVKVRRIRVEQGVSATTATTLSVQVLRLTSAGTGGTAVTTRQFDTADSASGATAMTLPSSKGAEGVVLAMSSIVMRQAVGATTAQVDDFYEWTQLPNQKPIIIPAGTTNGIAIKNLAAIAGSSLIVTVEFTEMNFV